MNLSLLCAAPGMTGFRRFGRADGVGRQRIGRYIALRTPHIRPRAARPADFDGDLRLGLVAALAAWSVVLAPLVG